MIQENWEHFCECYVKTTHFTTRLYKHGKLECMYSTYPVSPDPFTPYLEEMLTSGCSAGIIITPLQQIYGFLVIHDVYHFVSGPSQLICEDACLIQKELQKLGVPREKQKDYIHMLKCMRKSNVQRCIALLDLFRVVFDDEKLSVESLYTNFSMEDSAPKIKQQQILLSTDGIEKTSFQDWDYALEQVILGHIRHGETEKLKEILKSPPDMRGGPMFGMTLRDAKNTCISAATVASREAINSGIDQTEALNLCNLFINKAEQLQDLPSLEKLQTDIYISFAEFVRKVIYNIKTPDDSKGMLFINCVKYVSRNLYSAICMEDMAETLGYTRSYLCDRFKKQTGLTLNQYVTQQKILEAQRMLELTDNSLGQIAELLAFSSQSHFQNVFKRVTGETPLAYRQRLHKRKVTHIEREFLTKAVKNG